MAGIIASGAYIPRTRLSRAAILAANAWFNGGLRGLAKGERAVCNWDEDALTMAVEAARECLAGIERASVRRLVFASTSAPFADRQNAAILAEALNLGEDIATMDVGGSLRCATGALAAALQEAGTHGPTLLVAAEQRRAKAASTQEMTYGDAAAAVLVGDGAPLAEMVASHALSSDFVDHYRAATSRFDYAWEERWVRDEGQLRLIPQALSKALDKAGLTGERINRLLLPLPAGTGQRIARQLGIPGEALGDNLFTMLGDAGAAHPLLMLVDALASAGQGETILLAGWGQGCDALLLRAGAGQWHAKAGLSHHLARRRECANYTRYLAFNGLIEQERGIRSELDKQTPVSALYRNRDMILGFVGGRCSACGTVQFPPGNVCVSPNCGHFHSQEPCPMADRPAHIQSWTADNLTYTPDPPNHFGMVVFEDGGRLMMDFTDVEAGSLEVGQPLRMMFRIKDFDEKRGFRRYFWKAAPASG